MNVKMVVGIILIATIVTITLFATPIQAYLNGTANGDLLQTQDQGRQRVKSRDSNSNCTQTQNQERLQTNECATNRMCNQTMRTEQFRNQRRERARNQGD